ncbi:MAG: target of Sbf [Phylliscum demangeonii]|nr:MAG: target of Sbf [Phylliscum demangeonii]
MRLLIGSAAWALLTSTALANTGCTGTAQSINGNWYCSAVQQQTYDVFGKAGSYMEVVHMDTNTGTCTQQEKKYSGPMVPFDEGLSFHFRGPISIKKFAVYVPKCDASKVKAKPKQKRDLLIAHHPHHGHQHFHQRHPLQERAVGDWVTVTMDGKAVSWRNEWDGSEYLKTLVQPDAAVATHAHAPAATPATPGTSQPQYDVLPAPAAPVPTTTIAAAAARSPSPSSHLPHLPHLSHLSHPSHPSPSPSPSSSSTSASDASSASSNSDNADCAGSWARMAYYDAASKTQQGITVLNNMGGQGSGVFDYVFGNSLAYAAADGKTGSATPQVLDDMTLPSNTEVIFFSDEKCGDDNECGYVRPGTVAYHGFRGANKVFLLEFQMPHQAGPAGAPNSDMPAAWALNAKIPRTGQYVSEQCSCWKSGCGEFDVFEVLDAGDTRCKSTVHSNHGLGYSDYFDRPVDRPVKAAVLFMGSANKAHIKILDDATDFAAAIANEQIVGYCS